MERYLQRNRSKYLLGSLVLGQLLLLAYQVRRPDSGSIRTVRLWSVEAMLPAERVSGDFVDRMRGFFHGYVALQQVNAANQALRSQVAQLQLQNQQLRESAREIPALDALLQFQRAYGLRTEPAQIIGSGASADAQIAYLDRGTSNGLQRNMAVITPDGVIGKLSQVLSSSAQVLLVTDPESGVGALAGADGVHGILRGLGAGRVELRNVLKDEPLAVGAPVITSGEDQVYPKGIPVGTVTAVLPSSDGVFKSAQVKLAADLGRLESVLVVTAALPPPADSADRGLTAADIRQAKLPALPDPAAAPGSAAWPRTGPSAVPTQPNTPPAEGDALGPAPAAAGSAPSVVHAPAAHPAPPPTAKPATVVHGGG